MGKFHSPTLGLISLDRVIEEVTAYVKEDPEAKYTLIIGTDSHASFVDQKHCEVNFVTAIIVHRHGRGGRYFWRNGVSETVHTLRTKIYQETLLSLELAQQILPKIRENLDGEAEYELEIHLDVGTAGATRELVKEVVGMVQGNGFRAKTKPAGYGAFIVADKHT